MCGLKGKVETHTHLEYDNTCIKAMKHGRKHVVYTQLVNKEESYKHYTLGKDLAKAAKTTKIHKKGSNNTG
jgi:hypothetical protein